MTGKTNIVIATSEFPPLPGGIGNHAFNLAKQLSRKGYRVTVISNARGDADEERKYLTEKLRGVHMELIDRSGAFQTYYRRLKILRKQVRLLHEGDIIWLSGKFWVICAGWLKIKPGVKVFAVVHGTEISMQPSLFRNGLKHCMRIVCVSGYTRDKLLERYPEVQDKTIVINNGHDMMPTIGRNRSWSGNSVKLVTVGNVHPRKGQDAVIRMLPELRMAFPEIEYHIIGIPTYENEFIALAEKLNVKDLVTFYGKVSRDALIELLDGMDIFIMLSQELENGDFEGFGIAILEANAIGLPSVGTKNSGISDAIHHGVSGFLVNNNAMEVVQSIQTILASYPAFSREAIQWSDKFHWDLVADKYEQLIKSTPE